ncbi:MAG: CopG family transcriptional regulator [Opitutaceae bacterium]
MAEKTFSARLDEKALARFERKARKRGVSKTALLRQWIFEREAPTAGDAEEWEKRNEGNKRLRIDL